MGGPRDGRYYITSLLGLNYILGITADGNPGAPVVADGKGDIVGPLVFAPCQLRS